MFCGEASLVNYGEQKVRAAILRCKCWSCDMCLPLRKARLIRDVVDGEPTKFLTLSTRWTEGGDPDAEAQRQTAWFATLRRRMKKAWPSEDFAYYAVREGTKRGWPHLHIAMRNIYISSGWISKNWQDITGSDNIKIKKIYGSKGAAKYLAKYIGKNPMRFGTTKRYWCSKNWFEPRPEREPPEGDWDTIWHIVHVPWMALAELYSMRRYEFTLRGEFGFFEARAPP